jgi:hypothetical protein
MPTRRLCPEFSIPDLYSNASKNISSFPRLHKEFISWVSHSNKHTSLEKDISPKPHRQSTMVRKRKRWSSTAEESDRLDRSSRRDGFVRRQEFDQSRSSCGDGFDNRLSQAEESDPLDRSSRRYGFVRRLEFDQSRSSSGDGFDNRLSRAEESDRLDRSSRRDGFVQRLEFDQSRSSSGDGFDNRLSRAEESDRLGRSSRRDGFV